MSAKFEVSGRPLEFRPTALLNAEGRLVLALINERPSAYKLKIDVTPPPHKPKRGSVHQTIC